MSTTITIRTDEALHAALRRRAEAEGTTISELVRRLLDDALAERPLESRIAHLRGRLNLPSESAASWREELRQRNWRP